MAWSAAAQDVDANRRSRRATAQHGRAVTASTLISAGILIAVAITGAVALRRFPSGARAAFDGACFVAISIFLLHAQVSPVFPTPHGPLDGGALWLRAIGGAWWLLGARVVVALLWFAFHRDRRSRATKLVSDLTAAAIYIVTAVVVLNSVFALPITGVLATSGVFAIVLGLALQNTLADVFAGIAVGVEAPFRVGDRIQVGDRVEGQVVQVNWRSVRILTDGQDVAIIPHSLVAKAEIVNRSFPTQQRAVSVGLSCPAKSDPERVIETLLQATLLCPGVLQTPAPSVALTSLGPRKNAYAISFYVENTAHLGSQKGALLTQARRQLYYADLLPKSYGIDALAEGAELQPTSESAARLMRGLTLFECLSQAQVTQLAAATKSTFLEPEERLFDQGASDGNLYILASGVLKLEHQADTLAPSAVGSIGAGEYIGELGLLSGTAHAVSATARTHCHVFTISRDTIAPLLAENPGLVSALETAVRRGLEKLHRQVVARATEDVGPKGQLLMRMRSFFHLNTGRTDAAS